MAGKVLDAGRDPGLAQTSCALDGILGHHLRVVARTPDANNGVEGLAVDVANGSVVHVDAEISQRLACGLGNLIGALERTGGAQGHGSRQLGGHRRRDASHQAVFLVDANKKRLCVAGIFGQLLEAEAESLELLGVLDVALEEDNGSDAVVLDERFDFLVDFGSVKPNREQLSHGCQCFGHYVVILG
jgi:hypothetical protein